MLLEKPNGLIETRLTNDLGAALLEDLGSDRVKTKHEISRASAESDSLRFIRRSFRGVKVGEEVWVDVSGSLLGGEGEVETAEEKGPVGL